MAVSCNVLLQMRWWQRALPDMLSLVVFRLADRVARRNLARMSPFVVLYGIASHTTTTMRSRIPSYLLLGEHQRTGVDVCNDALELVIVFGHACRHLARQVNAHQNTPYHATTIHYPRPDISTTPTHDDGSTEQLATTFEHFIKR